MVSPLPPWHLRQTCFAWGQRTYVMGVLNVTPDSFSDGGEFDSVDRALGQAHRLVQAGVDMIDVGGQSTRPGSEPVPLATEQERVMPVIRALRAQFNTPISIDTTRAEVAAAAIAAGADVVNDISAGTYDAQMLPTVAKLGAPIVLMHLRGTPATMQQLTDYPDLMGEICAFLQSRVEAALAAGIGPGAIALDPGIGFAKTVYQNLEILRQGSRLRQLGYPLLMGPSRKSFIGHLLNQPDPKQRVWGTAAACAAAIAGGADLVRIHDAEAMVQVCRVADAIWRTDSSYSHP